MHNVYCKRAVCLKSFPVEDGQEEGYAGTGLGFVQHYDPNKRELIWLCGEHHLERAEHIHSLMEGRRK